MSHAVDLSPVLHAHEDWLREQELLCLERALKLSRLPNVENEINRLHTVAAVFSACQFQIQQQVLPTKKRGILATIFGAIC